MIRGVTADERLPRWLAVLAAVAATWLLLPPLTGPALGTTTAVEVVDHAVPGLVVLVATAAWWRREGLAEPAAGAFVLSGALSAGTHIPLIAAARDGRVDWLPVVAHSAPAFAVALVAVTAVGYLLVQRRRARRPAAA